MIGFRAPEYHADGRFRSAAFAFRGDERTGWEIERNGAQHLAVGPGYRCLPTRFCGVCATDLARRFLPFPLPQVIGHEVVAGSRGRPAVVEINDSHGARGLGADRCPFCRSGLENHCPERLTLGINRLPGGFAPYILAPAGSIHEAPCEIPDHALSLVEPFAAALQALAATPPQTGERVAVLGPRRLGMLTIAALRVWRIAENLDFEIAAIARHPRLFPVATALGADRALAPETARPQSFDLVFDTTGNPDGFLCALNLARRAVHVKSTHGKPVCGLSQLTAMVVDELAILPFRPDHLQSRWHLGSTRSESGPTNANVLVSPEVASESIREAQGHEPDFRFHRMALSQARERLESGWIPDGSRLPRFDLAVVARLGEVDAVLRGPDGAPPALVRPRGAVLLAGRDEAGSNPLADAVCRRGLSIHGSRCGDFRKALALFDTHPNLAASLAENLITHRFPLANIERAFQFAADSKTSIKVLIDTQA